MAIPIQSQIYNPITGVFGTGQMQIFGVGQSGTWYVPLGIGKVRVRCFGGGASIGAGGGFAIKSIYDLTGVTSVAVTVASAGGTSSFGSYVSATGGTTTPTGGSGVGGDINASGGSVAGGGVGSLFGNGGTPSIPGGSGYYTTLGFPAGNGILGSGGAVSISGTLILNNPTTGMPYFSIDFIGTGGGGCGSTYGNGINGGGGSLGGYPGGGGSTTGAPGMVIVEW